MLLTLNLGTLSTSGTAHTVGFGTLSTTGLGTLYITGDYFGAVDTDLTFSLFGALSTIFVGIAASLRCILFLLFSPCGVCTI